MSACSEQIVTVIKIETTKIWKLLIKMSADIFDFFYF